MIPSDRLKNIAPASNAPGEQRSIPESSGRRRAVGVACTQCRRSKSRCDGVRPACSRCKENQLPCQYDVAEGVSRSQRMKLLKRDGLATRVNELESIIQSLRAGTDEQATTILARLRLGEQVDDIARSLNLKTSALAQASSPAQSSSSMGLDSFGLTSDGESSQAFITSPSEDRMPAWLQSQQADGIYHRDYSTDFAYSPEENVTSVDMGMSITSDAQTVTWPGPSTSSNQLRRRRRRSSFLSVLFKRDDFLLVMRDKENAEDVEIETIDPRILDKASGGPDGTDRERPTRKSALMSHRKSKDRSFSTLLYGRQSIAVAAEVHPSLQNLFGNLPLSSSIRTNHYPSDIQDTQINNLHIPTWAMMSVTSRPALGSMRDVFVAVRYEATKLIQEGTPPDHVLGPHPNIAALFNEEEFNRSPLLCKWAAGMVHSIKLQGYDFTCFASMYLFWWVMRWTLTPSSETYEAMPDWIRPTPNQLFMPHLYIIDFIVWPAFRELVVQLPSMQEHMEWLMDLSINVKCHWPYPLEAALFNNPQTGFLDLTDEAKQYVRSMSNWSVGPTFRGFVPNADTYVNVRPEE